VRYEHYQDLDPPRRRTWMVALPLILFIVVALLWSGAWYYASVTAHTTIDGWRAREASLGRFYTCGSETIGGYPFRIEVGCTEPNAEWRSNQPPVAVRVKDLNVAAQIYDPTLLNIDFTGPLLAGTPGEAPTWAAGWSNAQASVRGLPATPERISTVFDKLTLTRITAANTDAVAQADHLELHGRIVAGSATPAIEIVLRLGAASAPALHPMASEPINGEITAILSGLQDFSPKPWATRLRDLQAAGGHIEIRQARLQQAGTIIVGEGALALTPRGRLDGQLRLTVVGLDRLLAGLNLDRVAAQIVPQKDLDKIAPGLDVNKLSQGLDRIMPGLGGAVRNNSGSIAAAGVAALGQPGQIDGKAAVILPLRFSDGAVFLGPVPLGQTPALF